ncbi:type I-B CRISPR-associated protein Cas7/Cst2/DevR [Deinococcus sp. YIM 134068]|uniref:type I-B CRISPR-associated protein Cas7/Cst2/DevR n=1 Tax=Deinococcus lichenicola TaxID=3118910 RepID=UPI002F95655D
MAFLSGFLLIDAPASALNNARDAQDAQYDNEVGVKLIRVGRDSYPYVSAQAFRYWLRDTLAQNPDWLAHTAPVFREAKVAYTDANPIKYWDDDLFGYMRAEGKKASAKDSRADDAGRANATELSQSITRTSPFRVGTLVSLAPSAIVKDFGTMSRTGPNMQEGDPVPHSHQFYRAVFKGQLSLDLGRAGLFTYTGKSGNQNLDEVRRKQADEQGLEHLTAQKAYRLNREQRIERLAPLIRALAELRGGAKQALHYTDVTPAAVLLVVTKGGNNPLQYVVGGGEGGQPRVNVDALKETVRAWRDTFLSPVYVGWTAGFHDPECERLRTALEELRAEGVDFVLEHPRTVLRRVADDLSGDAGVGWLD